MILSKTQLAKILPLLEREMEEIEDTGCGYGFQSIEELVLLIATIEDHLGDFLAA